MKQAREVALDALTACERQGAWSDGYLKKAIGGAKLDGRDAALATRLCFGVLQNRMLLDFYLSKLCATPLHKLEASIRNLLRLGAYQLLYLNRVPDHAAVSEAVSLARKKAKNPRAAGLVNGVLRSLIRQREALEPPADLSTRYSHPQWLVDSFVARLGREEAEALLAADNGEPPTCAQVNTLKISAEELAAMLTAEGVAVEPHPWLPDCLFLNGTGSLEHLEAFQKGYFYIQDAAAHLAVLAAAPQPGWRVLDACAAPGGKSFAAAIAMENRGSVTSCDIHPHKLRLIEAGYQRLGLDIIHANLLDGKERKAELLNSFDLVIADVPCSGLGIIRKKPDIRYKDPKPLENLPRVQAAILDNVADYVRPGGVLLYATCTLLERENEGVVRAFLDKQRDFTLEGFQVSGPFLDTDTGMLTCWPHRHGTDGFFFAKLRRIRWKPYEVYPRDGLGPFRLGMTEEKVERLQNRLGLPESPESFYCWSYEDGWLARIGLHTSERIRISGPWTGTDPRPRGGADSALAREAELCLRLRGSGAGLIPIASRSLAWSCGGRWPTTLSCWIIRNFRRTCVSFRRIWSMSRPTAGTFQRYGCSPSSGRILPLEPCRAPYDGGPYRPAPEPRPVTPERLAAVAKKYGLEPPGRPGGGENA